MKKIMFRKNGNSKWEEWNEITLKQFNEDYADWIERYYEDDAEVPEITSWEQAEEILNTVGASAKAGEFKIEEAQ